MKTADWLQALRSGEYKQTKRMLSNGAGGFCCLGVLCEVKGLPKKVVKDHSSTSGLHVTYIFDLDAKTSESDYNYSTDFSSGVIPTKYQPAILEDLDLSLVVEDPGLGGHDELANVLMNLNDDGKSFAQIADFIEKVVNDSKTQPV